MRLIGGKVSLAETKTSFHLGPQWECSGAPPAVLQPWQSAESSTADVLLHIPAGTRVRDSDYPKNKVHVTLIALSWSDKKFQPTDMKESETQQERRVQRTIIYECFHRVRKW